MYFILFCFPYVICCILYIILLLNWCSNRPWVQSMKEYFFLSYPKWIEGAAADYICKVISRNKAKLQIFCFSRPPLPAPHPTSSPYCANEVLMMCLMVNPVSSDNLKLPRLLQHICCSAPPLSLQQQSEKPSARAPHESLRASAPLLKLCIDIWII